MTSAGPAASPLATTGLGGRAWRDRSLGISALVFAGSAALFMVGLMLRLIDALQVDALVGYSVATGFQMLSPLVAIPALTVASIAFLVAQSRRAGRLGAASAILVAAFAVGVVGDVIEASVAGTHDAPGKVVAALSLEAAADLGLVVAAALAAVAFSASAAGGIQALPRRDGLLGWGSVSIAIAFAFTTASTILFLTVYSDLGATSGYTTGVGIAAGGAAATTVAAVLAAVGFFVSRWRQHKGDNGWLTGRDVTLGAGTAIFSVAFLLSAIGVTIVATADPDNGITGKEAASDWLAALGYFTLVLTAASASVGFLFARSRR